MDPGASRTGYGARSPKVAVTASRYYTGVVWALSALATLKARLNWYTAGDVLLTQSAGGGISLGGGWTAVYVRAQADASAAKADLDVWYDGTSDEVIYWGCASIGALEDYDWWLPSTCPGVVILSAAPAAGSEVLATDEGYRIGKRRCDRRGPMVYDGAGNLSVRLSLVEVWDSEA
jgi:hypothetical protein